MSKKMIVTTVLVLTVLAAGAWQSAAAQESGAAKAASAEKTLTVYRLDFSLNELEDGKKINSRQYSMNLVGGEANEFKIGTRVPVDAGKEGEYQYLDVGTNIWCQLREHGSDLLLVVRADASNFAPTPEGSQEHSSRPLIRQVKINASTNVALLNKPTVIGSADDPNSKRQFQLEVTATKLR
ncbi:MAG TPA: hypothetical protein VGM18_18760 [Candidatus Sulfotelmatobacter sp.]|jgi:hypothetical protein